MGKLALIIVSVWILAFVQVQTVRSQQYDNSFFRLVVGPTPDDNIQYPAAKWPALLRKLRNCPRKKTFYFFGWNEKYSDESLQILAKAYLTRRDERLIVFDWSSYNSGDYMLVAGNISGIANYTAAIFTKMFSAGLDLKKVHIVGHSVGTHLVGVLGMDLQDNGFTLPRITALDPVGLYFYTPNHFNAPVMFEGLSADAAKFVDVIHTDTVLVGASVSCGTVDFYPNGGFSQPGCPPLNMTDVWAPNNFCSHMLADKFWSESVAANDRPVFDSVKCPSWEAFQNNTCTGSCPFTHMGYNADPKLTGNYYLTTNSAYPFSLESADCGMDKNWGWDWGWDWGRHRNRWNHQSRGSGRSHGNWRSNWRHQ